MNEKSFAAWLSFALWVGAANADATPMQRTALRSSLSPVIQHLRSERSKDPEVWKSALRNAFGIIQQIMGASWQPRGEWAEQINALIGEDVALQEREAAAMDVRQPPDHGAPMGASRQARERRKAQEEGRA